MKKKIALEGAINGCSDAQANDWRQEAIKRLGHKYDFHNPMDLDCRGREKEMRDEIRRFDLSGMAGSDIGLFNYSASSTGTDVGMTYMWMLHKHIVMVYPGKDPDSKPWLFYDVIFKTIDEAFSYLLYKE